jgi:phage-related protein
MNKILRTLFWVGSSKKDLMKMPTDVQDIFGFALHLAQSGEKHPDAKPLKDFGGAGVLEVVENYERNTFRAVYTIRYTDTVYVLHCFQKKSHQGIETPKHDMELIRSRLKSIEESMKG